MKKDIKLRGEFQYRILKNYTRLQEKEYRPEYMFRQTEAGYDWPGDWEGRTLLALVLLKRITGAEPAYLEELLLGLYELLKEKGYLGAPNIEKGQIDEQQLSGHNWLLRGLLECASCDLRPMIEEMIVNMVEHLYLPALGFYERYPLDKCRNYNGNAIGELQKETVNGWLLSTDIGCAYMSLDALSQYYQIYHDERILPLLREMAETFMKIDFAGASLQTQASLCATRGILRLYQETGEEKYWAFAKYLFDFYFETGMTENYGNYNWFGRPTWTEPCAIVDSFLLAVELFKQSENSRYLEIANKILYNALGYAQRSNGGFGCDKCAVAGGENELLWVQEELYEASWCCSMRGAEGLTFAASNAFWQGKDRGFFTNYLSGEYDWGDLKFTVDTAFPYKGKIVVSVEKCPAEYRLKCFIPEHTDLKKLRVWIDDKSASVELEGGMLLITLPGPCTLTLDIPLHIHTLDTIQPSTKRSCWYGILQLGCDAEDEIALEDLEKCQYNEAGCFSLREHVLFPINQNIYVSREDVLKRKVKILF